MATYLVSGIIFDFILLHEHTIQHKLWILISFMYMYTNQIVRCLCKDYGDINASYNDGKTILSYAILTDK